MKRKSLVPIIFGGLLLFVVGNRLSLLYQHLLQENTNVIYALLGTLSDFLSSFKSNYLGLKIGTDIVSIISGIITIIIADLLLTYYKMSRKNYRPNEEHGSSRYGDIQNEANELKDESFFNNMILSQTVLISLNTFKTWLNNNILVIGGSGSGKTRFFVKPNILNMVCNYVTTDPKMSVLKEVGKGFVKKKFDVKILNLIHMDRSMKYNPYKYIEKPNDVLKLINNIVANTTKENAATGGDDFFVKAEVALLTALSFFVMAVGNEKERNIPMIMELLDLAEASEEDEEMQSELDIMFEQLAEENKQMKELGLPFKNSYRFLAERQYRLYKKAAGKTAKSILISVGVRMAVFNIPEVSELLSDDELDLYTVGNPKKDSEGNYIRSFVVCGISDSDATFTFIASILYQQLFDLLYLQADATPRGRLPIHTRFILDEFANIGKIPDFERKIATMRSREISVAIILQNLAQLKNLYKDSWETIFGNCDTTLFLGGKELSTSEYLSKLIGNTTIDYRSVSETKGGNGSVSISNQLIQRPLLDPAEISRLKRDECLIHIRGFHIFKDKKYDLLKHPNIDLTDDSPNKIGDELLFTEEEQLEYILNKRNQNKTNDIDHEIVGIYDLNITNENVQIYEY